MQRQRFQQWHHRGVGKCTSYFLPRTPSDCFERGIVCQQDDVSACSNSVAPSYGTMLCSQPWYLYGCIEHAHNEADEVMRASEKQDAGYREVEVQRCLAQQLCFFLRVASLIVPTRGEQTATTTLDNDRKDDDMHSCHVGVSNVFSFATERRRSLSCRRARRED